MFSAVRSVNDSGVMLSRLKLLERTEFYTKQYFRCCNELYDLGFSSSPSDCDLAKVMSIVFSTYPNLQPLFCSHLSGECTYNELMISYVLDVIDLDDECKNVLYIVLLCQQSIQALKDFDLLCKKARVPLKLDTFTVKANLSVSSTVSNSNKIPLESPYIQELIVTPTGYHLVDYDYTGLILKQKLRKLGVSVNVIEDYASKNKSLLIGDAFTFEDDCKYLDLFLSGTLIGLGLFGRLLYGDIERYYIVYSEGQTTKAFQVPYQAQAFIDARDSCVEALNEYRGSLQEGFKTIFITPKKVIFAVSGGVEMVHDENTDYFIGNYVHNYGTGCKLNVVNQLRGFSGEYIKAVDLPSLDIKSSGLPVKMWDYRATSKGTSLEVFECYPIVSCYIEEDGLTDSLVPFYGTVGTFEWLAVDEICRKYEIDSLELLYSELISYCKTAYPDISHEEAHLISEFVQALICVRCDYTLRGRKSPNHVVLEKPLAEYSQQTLETSYYLAVSVFEKLGF